MNGSTILLAESGSTKTAWRLIKNNESVRAEESIGLNPYFADEKDLEAVIKAVFCTENRSSIHQVFFYGAGCSNQEIVAPFRKAFQKIFPQAKIEIQHDLVAAARALFHEDKGLPIILGTGSNSCLWDGNTCIDNIPALGFALGDEGSGAHLGKSLVIKYMYNELDAHLNKKLDAFTSKDEILEHVYKKPFPNRYLASFSTFIYSNLDHPQMQDLVRQSFQLFIEKHVLPYPNYQDYSIGIVGSIGYYYQKIFKEIALGQGLEIRKIVRLPIDELVKFHIMKS